MAVYTEVTDEALASFLTGYDIGTMIAFRGIAEGIENSNFSLRTTDGDFILTLYEKRVDPADLPWFLGLMEHLAQRGQVCPQPVRGRDGSALRNLSGKHAAITTFLPGVWPRRVRQAHCGPVGAALAKLHMAGADYAPRRVNALGPQSWAPLLDRCRARADEVQAGLVHELDSALRAILGGWPQGLPVGHIHADMFPDNVFFLDEKVSGVIDFYFAATDLLAYDVAVCLNAWCFEADFTFNVTKSRALLAAYQSVRPLAAAEQAALPVLCQGAAIRFLLTRVYDWLHTPSGAMVTRKDPMEYLRRLRFHLSAANGGPMASDDIVVSLPPDPDKVVEIWTDGGCKPNPGPGGWSAIMTFRNVVKELSGAEPATTNNRMELTAAAEALESLKRPCHVVVHTDSQYLRDGITRWSTGWVRKGWRNASGDPVANIDLWKRILAAQETHRVEWRWVRGHDGNDMNERADRLATEARRAAFGGARQ